MCCFRENPKVEYSGMGSDEARGFEDVSLEDGESGRFQKVLHEPV